MLKAVGPTALEENVEEAMAVFESLLDLQGQIEAASTLIACSALPATSAS